MKLRLLCTLLLVPAAVFAAAALPIEFNGVLIQGGKTTVSLLNPNTGTARWVALGGKFDTYIITSYLPDPKGADVVVLTKAGTSQTVRVVLKNSLIVAVAPLTYEQRMAVQSNLYKIQQAADEYFLGNDASSVTIDKLVDPSNPLMLHDPLTPVVGENYSGMVLKKMATKLQCCYPTARWLPLIRLRRDLSSRASDRRADARQPGRDE